MEQGGGAAQEGQGEEGDTEGHQKDVVGAADKKLVTSEHLKNWAEEEELKALFSMVNF